MEINKKAKAPFIDEISGLAIVKMLDGDTHSTLLLKLKFTQNEAILDITNKGTDTMIFVTRGNDRNHRFKVIRILQDQTGNTTTELK